MVKPATARAEWSNMKRAKRERASMAEAPDYYGLSQSARFAKASPLRALAGSGTHRGVEEESSSQGKLRYRRVIIKLSGEALSGKEGGSGIDTTTLKATASELAEVHGTGVQLGLVVGG